MKTLFLSIFLIISSFMFGQEKGLVKFEVQYEPYVYVSLGSVYTFKESFRLGFKANAGIGVRIDSRNFPRLGYFDEIFGASFFVRNPFIKNSKHFTYDVGVFSSFLRVNLYRFSGIYTSVYFPWKKFKIGTGIQFGRYDKWETRQGEFDFRITPLILTYTF